MNRTKCGRPRNVRVTPECTLDDGVGRHFWVERHVSPCPYFPVPAFAIFLRPPRGQFAIKGNSGSINERHSKLIVIPNVGLSQKDKIPHRQLPLLQTEDLFQTRRPKTKWIIGPSQQLHLNLNLSVEMSRVLQLPHEIIATGDSAYLTLSLVCRWFRDVVTDEFFRKAAHFAWLNSVVNWKKFLRTTVMSSAGSTASGNAQNAWSFSSPIHQGTGEEENEGNCWAFTPKIFVQDFARRTVFFCCRK
ncbi:hypothetical protein F2P79_008470 [Pimephales promelas]|nr:hypothetical protein F2P79_008470 [Pimephales promelas]